MGDKQGHILVVDDLDQWRNQLVEILQKEGYYADAASSVAEAKEYLKQHLYHVLLLDMRMKEGDGTNQEGPDLLRELSKQGLSEAIKVIIITAYGTKEWTREAFKAFDVYDFLFKDSFKKEAFLHIVGQVFSTINLQLNILWQPTESARQTILNLEIDGMQIPVSRMETSISAICSLIALIMCG